MNPNGTAEIQETLAKVFAGNLPFGASFRRAQFLALDRQRSVFRALQRQDAEAALSSLPTGAEHDPDRPWRLTSRLRDMLLPGILAALRVADIDPTRLSSLPASAAEACRYAERLLQQLGEPNTALIDTARYGPDDALCSPRAATATVSEVRNLPTQWAHKIEAGLDLRAADLARCWGHKVHGICFLAGARTGPLAHWVARDGTVLRRQTPDEFARELFEPVLSGLGDRLERLKESADRRRQAVERALRNGCPRLAQAVELALRAPRAVGVRICRTRIHEGHVPFDAWLYVQSDRLGFGLGRCVLSARRAMPDFILQAAGGDLYYFPPCMVVCRIAFGMGGPHVEQPRIQQPAGGHRFKHPYVGDLGEARYAAALRLDADDLAMFPVDDQAHAWFPQLSRTAATWRERDLCLSGQTSVVRGAQAKLSAGPSADILGVIRQVHTLARNGLTRGHQQNTSTPRVRMDAESMLYRLGSRRPLAGTGLAERIHAYDPARPVLAVGRGSAAGHAGPRGAAEPL